MTPDTLTAVSALLPWIEIAATVAFAVSGVMEGARKRLDAIGVGAVACLAAFGGGTLRDLLIDQRPFFWARHPEYVWLVLALVVAAMLFLRLRHLPVTERAMRVPDALGLGLFAATGVSQALATGLSPLLAVLIGVITGVFGGVLRDIACNEIPYTFRDHRPYALLAFVGGWAYVAMDALGAHPALALLLTAGLIAGSRLLAVWLDWRLPAWRVDG